MAGAAAKGSRHGPDDSFDGAAWMLNHMPGLDRHFDDVGVRDIASRTPVVGCARG